MNTIYNIIDTHYDTTRRADPEIVSTFAKLLNINHGKQYVDVACGTGNYTIELQKLTGEWFGFDQSQKMLDKAIAKSPLIHWENFDVTKLGYQDEQFDGAICCLAIHHFSNLDLAFSEIARVLKQNASLIIFTSTPEQMCHYWLTKYFPEMMRKSCTQMPSQLAIKHALKNNGFDISEIQPFFIQPTLDDFFLYSGKQRPEMYLSEKVRNGISSFKNFCTDLELASGLSRLKEDIDSNVVDSLINQANHESDYLFVAAQKASST